MYSQNAPRVLIAPANTHHVIGQVEPLYFNGSLELPAHDYLTWAVCNATDCYTIARNDVGVYQGNENDYELDRTNLIVKNANFGSARKYLMHNIDSPRTQLTAEAIIFGKF